MSAQANSGPRSGRSARRERALWALIICAAVAVIIGVPLLLGVGSSPRSTSPSPPSFATRTASLGNPNGSTVALVPQYLGVNLRANAVLSPASQSALNSTFVRLVRWPGGGDGDRLDPLADSGKGLLYNDSGVGSPPGTSLAQFVQWCRSVSCDSIVTLPAEVDNSSLAASIVNYTETTLGFRPTYWEIGNEPALWTHFGLPWDRWNTSQDLTPTPSQFAGLVGQYVQAVRSVDSVTGIIGLGGIGGSGNQSTWISDTVATDGPNLSAIAIHVYPAGAGYASNQLNEWFATLWGRSALPYRVPDTWNAIDKACPTCHLSLLVDEFQTGTQLLSSNSLSGGYLATYVAAEIAQSLPLSVSSLCYYDFQSDTPGAWLDESGSGSASFALYQGLTAELGSFARAINVSSSAQGVLAVEGGSSAGSLTSLLVVNSNTTYGARINLSARFASPSSALAWVFNGSASSPTVFRVGAAGAVNWTLPPASLVIFSGVGVMTPLPTAAETPAAGFPPPTALPLVPSAVGGSPSLAIAAPPRPEAAGDPRSAAKKPSAPYRPRAEARHGPSRTRAPLRTGSFRTPQTGRSTSLLRERATPGSREARRTAASG